MAKQQPNPTEEVEKIEVDDTLSPKRQFIEADIKTAIAAVQTARQHLVALTIERAVQQLSSASLSVLCSDLAKIERRMAVYVKD